MKIHDESKFKFNNNNVLIEIQGDLEEYSEEIEKEYLYPIYLDIREKYMTEHFIPISKEEFLDQNIVELINNPDKAIKEIGEKIKETLPSIKPLIIILKKLININDIRLSEQFKLLFSFVKNSNSFFPEYFASIDMKSQYGFYVKLCENKVKPNYYKQLLLGEEIFDTNIGKFTCKCYKEGNELIMKRAFKSKDYEKLDCDSILDYIKIEKKEIKLPHQLVIIYKKLVEAEKKWLNTCELEEYFKKSEKNKKINITNKLSELRNKLRDEGISNRFIPINENGKHFIPHIKYCEKVE